MTSHRTCDTGVALTTLILLAQWASPAAQAIERHVPGDYPTIQAAIDACVDGDQVVIEPNTYTGPGNRHLNFGGRGITVRGTDPTDPNVVAATVIDCGGTEADRHRGFTFSAGEDPDSIVAGLTIAEGYGPTETIEALTVSVGGAIYCMDSSPTIADCRFVDNLADDYGGAICCIDGEPIITRCSFSDNEGGAGGGVYCFLSDAIIYGCDFTGNVSLSHGGAIACYFARPLIGACAMSGNSSLSTGGAVYLRSTNAEILADCTISGNSSELGGGVCSSFGHYSNHQQTVAGCSITGNSADRNGGGIYSSTGSIAIARSIISNNASGAHGGGIYCSVHNDATFTSCVVANNHSAADGGGIYCTSYSEPGVTLCTISDNAAGSLGGGIFCDDTSVPTINSSILWGNTATLGPQIALTSKSEGAPAGIDVSFSDVQGGVAEVYIDPNCVGIDGPGNIDLDPLFVDPDGPDDDPNTWLDNDYHLSVISMCINRGDPSGDYAGQADVDGEPRVADGRVDMGADEFPNSLSSYYYVLDLQIRAPWQGRVVIEPNDPNEVPFTYPAGTVVTLTAVPEGQRTFRGWRIYDPNHPGDGSHAATDANNPITIVMDADREVTAVFQCGGGGIAPLLLLALGALALLRRRR